MHTFKKLPRTSPNRKNAAARKYTLPAGSKVFRDRSASIVASEGDYMDDLLNGKLLEFRIRRRQVSGPVDLLAIGQAHLGFHRLPSCAILFADCHVEAHLVWVLLG